MEQNQKGSKSYLISIVMVAVLGGLLFGYDTAVISGAEKGVQAFFKSATDFEYTDFMHGFTSSSALIGCIIGSALSGLFASKSQHRDWKNTIMPWCSRLAGKRKSRCLEIPAYGAAGRLRYAG